MHIGVASFWRGNVASILRYFPSQALNFAFKDKFKRFLVPSSRTINKQWSYMHFVMGNLLAGGLAGAAALTCTYPLDMARTRLAADIGAEKRSASYNISRKYTGIISCLVSIFKRLLHYASSPLPDIDL